MSNFEKLWAALMSEKPCEQEIAAGLIHLRGPDGKPDGRTLLVVVRPDFATLLKQAGE